jgi:uncharacterized protein YcbK (DUF882 family)
MFQDLMQIQSAEDLIGGRIQGVERRDVLKLGLAGLLAAIVPVMPSRAFASEGRAWRVNIHNSHTKEKFSGVYRVGDRYLPEAFERLNYVLRDFRTGEIFPMDPRVVDIASIIQGRIHRNAALEVLSGYRCPKTNAMLREGSRGVAKNSLHMYGQALDIRAPGYNTKELRNVAKSLRAGGVGYYPRSNFVHVDTGQIRSW